MKVKAFLKISIYSVFTNYQIEEDSIWKTCLFSRLYGRQCLNLLGANSISVGVDQAPA